MKSEGLKWPRMPPKRKPKAAKPTPINTYFLRNNQAEPIRTSGEGGAQKQISSDRPSPDSSAKMAPGDQHEDCHDDKVEKAVEKNATVLQGSEFQALTSKLEEKLLGALTVVSKDLGDKILSVHTGLHSDIGEVKTQLTSLQSKCDTNLEKIVDLEQSVEYAHNDISQVKQENKELWAKMRALERDLSASIEGQVATADKVHDLERRSREYNFRIIGVPEKERENCPKVVAKLLVESKWADGKEEDVLNNIEVAHRTGKQRPRQIIVRCITRRYKNSVVRAAKTKRRTDKIIAFEDLTQRDYQARQSAKPQMQEAYEKGFNVRFVRGRVIVGEQRIPQAEGAPGPHYPPTGRAKNHDNTPLVERAPAGARAKDHSCQPAPDVQAAPDGATVATGDTKMREEDTAVANNEPDPDPLVTTGGQEESAVSEVANRQDTTEGQVQPAGSDSTKPEDTTVGQIKPPDSDAVKPEVATGGQAKPASSDPANPEEIS